MSAFLSQLELNPQVDQHDDEEALEKEDVEREKEIKELLANELNDDDFFDDDRSFSSHQTSGNTSNSHLDSYNQFYEFPNAITTDNRPGVLAPGPLLTSRGSDFLNKMSPKDNLSDGLNVQKNSKMRENQQKYDSENNNLYFEHKASLPADCDASEEHSKYKNWGTKITNNNLVYKHYGYDGREPYHSDDLHENLQYADGDCDDDDGKHDTDSYVHGRTLDSFHNQFSGNSRNGNSYGANMRGFYDDHSGRDAVLHNVQDYPDDYLRQFPDKNQVQAMVTTSDEDKSSSLGLDNIFNQHDIKQLRVLYEARGKKIEELQMVLEDSKEKQGKELRIIQHKLALITGERDGISTSLKQSHDLIREEREKGIQLERQLLEEQKRNEKLNDIKLELAEKLEISESTIESLNQQLTSLSHAESLSRLRSQHEVLMSTLRQRHEEEILHLKEKLDDNRKELNWKIEDVNRLQDELLSSKKFADKSKVESAETINRLSKSLEDSQRQLREILEEGEYAEASKKRYSLKEALNEKNSLEAENKELKEEVKNLTEQLGMFEAVIGTSYGPSSSTPYGEQIINKRWNDINAFKTPISRLGRHSSLGDSPIGSIKDELVKALAMINMKKGELKDAKGKIDMLQTEVEKVTKENKRLQKAIESFKIEREVTENVNTAVVTDSGGVESFSDLQSQIKDANEKIEELENQHNRLKDENSSLKSEISRMIKDFDRDKIDALKNCEKTYMQLNEDTRRSLEEKLKEEHQDELESLRKEIIQLKNELFDVKDSYVVLVNENKALENQIRLECEEELKQRLMETKNALNEAHKEELRQQEELMSSRQWTLLEEERRKMKDSFNDELSHKVQTAISVAKVEWFAAYETEKANAIESAVENARFKIVREKDLEIKKLTATIEEEFEKGKQVEKLELEKAYRLETEKLIKEALDKVQSKAENDEKQRLITAIVDELGINEHENEGSAVINAIQSLKQEVCEYKEQIERIELGAAIKENALVGEVESRNTEQIKNAVNAAKTSWLKEKSQLMQEILKEESQRIRGELLLDFTEGDHWEKYENVTEHDEDLYLELREFIKYLKSIYSKKLRELREMMEDQSEKMKKEQEDYFEKHTKENKESFAQKLEEEKQFAIESVNEKWEKFFNDAKNDHEEAYKERLAKELERARDGWKRDLEELQKEHETVLRDTVNDLQSRNEAEQMDLKRNFSEYLRNMKREFTDRMEKQKLELEEYHSELTKKTLALAKREWDLQLSCRDNQSRQIVKKNQSHRAIYNSMRLPTVEGSLEQFSDFRLDSSDSGITSPNLLHHRSTPKIAVDSNSERFGAEKGKLLSHNTKHISMQTDSEEDNTLTLQDMRKYYLETVNGIRDDVFKHVKKTKENAAIYFKKQVAKERKMLLEKLRRKFLRILKENQENLLEKETKTVILQVLKDIDFEEENCFMGADDKINGKKLHSQKCASEKGNFSKLDDEARISKEKDIEKSTLPVNKEAKIGKPSKINERKLPTMKKSSPCTSIISCDSNGTFYTDLPSTVVVTPLQSGTLPSLQNGK